MLDIYKPWVKYVNNQSINKGIKIVYKVTVLLFDQKTNTKSVNKLYFIPTFKQSFTNYLSTTKNRILNLLSNSFTHNPHSLLLSSPKEN